MKWPVRIVLSLVGIIGAVYGIGFTLPQSHEASGELVLDHSPEEVWETLTRVLDYPSWRSDVDAVRGGTDPLATRRWSEEPGGLNFGTERVQLGSSWTVRILGEGLPFGGSWSYQLAHDSRGTHLTITEHGEVYNPVFRFVSRFIMGHEATLNRYLADLEVRLPPNPPVP